MPSQSINRIKIGLAEKLRETARRRRTFVRMAQDEIAMQIRSLREKREFKTQSDFAKHAKMQQSAVSRIENAEYQGWTFKTLLKVANALDARLRITFEPAEDVIRRFERSEADATEIAAIQPPQEHAAAKPFQARFVTSSGMSETTTPQIVVEANNQSETSAIEAYAQVLSSSGEAHV